MGSTRNEPNNNDPQRAGRHADECDGLAPDSREPQCERRNQEDAEECDDERRDEARGPGTPGRLESDAPGPGAADALLAVRQEGGGSCRGGKA